MPVRHTTATWLGEQFMGGQSHNGLTMTCTSIGDAYYVVRDAADAAFCAIIDRVERHVPRLSPSPALAAGTVAGGRYPRRPTMTTEPVESTEIGPEPIAPNHHLQHQLGELPAGLPAVLMLGTGLTLVGSYTGNVELIGVDDQPSTIAAQVMVAACSCPDPETDVDPDCPRHYPRPPAELVALVARAVRASRGWSYRAGMGPHVPGCDDTDVNAAEAVLAALLTPGRNGVVGNEPGPVSA